MQFRYRVINEEMRVTNGVLEAVDLEAARRQIVENKWQIISLEKESGLSSLLTITFNSKVKYESIAAFCSQMAMMIRSGANLVRGLEILRTQMEDKRLQEVVGTIHRGVSRGDSLSAAMRECQGALPELLINLVSVGEESGNLDSVLVSMAEYYERENFIRKKITSASIYPIILTVVLIGLVILFMNFILPEITDLMKGNGQSLPAPTQMIVDTADYLNNNGLYLLLSIAALVGLMIRIFKIPKYRFYLHTFLLGVPLLGKNTKDVVIARFSRTLALFLHSSLPIVPILNSLENIVGNEVPRLAVARAKDRIIRGETMALAFGVEPFFDPLVIQMMSIGEETGRMEELMVEVAKHYDKRVEIGLARLVALVEPFFTVIIGIFAGGLIIAIALPIFNMASGVSGAR
ncbi:type II secretion system F family protein [Desulfosporosinus sp. BICA1-9]|uniref:type II secretion system F family protein n=1 Tax=Desulfosporosinus sp. BICA1-9 TaxID=1531958 RepID=UPI00054C035D|nr:type II secretion system F family protein [Desulfosporosinus sp. BICA1-9]KJS49782.1 MAG: type II secretion protein F [Peptococcaceae bacterium BRH_c23]KJS78828.1 MAG: type II secretion protein F [Desulfosporosinus sp. BICA1-9]HBW36176.1 type II secretion system F family protein [Desulfosporosinus sp.]